MITYNRTNEGEVEKYFRDVQMYKLKQYEWSINRNRNKKQDERDEE